MVIGERGEILQGPRRHSVLIIAAAAFARTTHLSCRRQCSNYAGFAAFLHAHIRWHTCRITTAPLRHHPCRWPDRVRSALSISHWPAPVASEIGRLSGVRKRPVHRAGCCCGILAYSLGTFASLTSFAYFAVSLRNSCANSSGLLPISSFPPWSISFWRTSGIARTFFVSS